MVGSTLLSWGGGRGSGLRKDNPGCSRLEIEHTANQPTNSHFYQFGGCLVLTVTQTFWKGGYHSPQFFQLCSPLWFQLSCTWWRNRWSFHWLWLDQGPSKLLSILSLSCQALVRNLWVLLLELKKKQLWRMEETESLENDGEGLLLVDSCSFVWGLLCFVEAYIGMSTLVLLCSARQTISNSE